MDSDRSRVLRWGTTPTRLRARTGSAPTPPPQAAGPPRVGPPVPPADAGRPLGPPHPGGQDPHRGRLPGPVRPQQPEHLAAPDREADPVDRVPLGLAVPLDQVPDLHHGRLPVAVHAHLPAIPSQPSPASTTSSGGALPCR